MKINKNVNVALADLGGARPVRAPPPPYGSRFFHFDMQNFRNVAASGVHGPSYEVHAPPMGNPGSATVLLPQGNLGCRDCRAFIWFLYN